MPNPLLDYRGLPPFGAIAPGHVGPAVDAVLADNRAAIAALVATAPAPEYASALLPLEHLSLRLQRVWSPVCHLHAVADDDALRAAYNEALPKITAYHTELYQHPGLHGLYRSVREAPAFRTLGAAERKVVDDALRDFRLAGIDLPEAAQACYREARSALSRQETAYEQNVLDATHGWRRHVTDGADLAGLPESALALAAEHARRASTDGWVFTLEAPSYLPVMMYAHSRELRRDLYGAYVTRASDQGPCAGRWDNGEPMTAILELRARLADVLGFANYAELSLATKMAGSPAQVLDFLRDLAVRARPLAQAEFAELSDFARSRGGPDSLEAWDVAFHSEGLRVERHAISAEELRPYFPLPRVLEGLFAIVGRLYGLAIVEQHDVATWHPDVRCFRIDDRTGAPRGMFYLDACARPHKRGGAWMDDCLTRHGDAGRTQLPVAYLNCNFAPAFDGTPTLLTHDEVVTLFHEFGHGLHHLLTLVDRPAVAGINGVAWDAVELPSQFMESWCWEPEALALMSGHCRTGEPLPQALVGRLRAARGFQAGMQMVRQIEYALFDFLLHMEVRPPDGAGVQSLLDAVRADVAVIPYPPFNRFQHAFTHIFGGGYAAGYYSYKWAEVLAADAYGAFEETAVFDPECGERFLRTILEQGGSRDAMDLYVEFRGRPPRIDALLRRAGITA